MDNLATIKMELGLNVQRILSNFKTNNLQLENVITKGIERAISEMLEKDNFEDYIVDAVKEEVEKSIKQIAGNWILRHKIQEEMRKALDAKIDKLADDWSNKIIKNLEK